MMNRRPLLLAALFGFVLIFLPQKSSSDGPHSNPEFVYARIRFHMTPEGMRMGELPWHHDYPFGDEMFPGVLGEVSTVKTDRTAYQIVDIDSPELFKYPFAYLSEPGFLSLTEKDAENFRKWLDRGGFVIVDDMRTCEYSRYTRGPEDDINHFRMELKKVYPDRDLVPLTVSDAIFNTFYKIDSLDMTAPYIFPGQGPVEFLGLRDKRGNLQMVIDNNNDISEYWQWLDEGQMSLHDATTSLHYGMNYALYALTH